MKRIMQAAVAVLVSLVTGWSLVGIALGDHDIDVPSDIGTIICDPPAPDPGCLRDPFAAVHVSPNVQSPSVAVGERFHDAARLLQDAPPGLVTFALYGPNDPTCSSSAIRTSTKQVPGDRYVPYDRAGDGSSLRPSTYYYGSDYVSVGQLGVYRWRVTYTSPAYPRSPVTTDCGLVGQSIAIARPNLGGIAPLTIRGSMEGHAHVAPAVDEPAWVAAGYSLKLGGNHPAAIVYAGSGSVQLPVRCKDHGPPVGTIDVLLPAHDYAIPENSRDWQPTGDQDNSASFQGSTQVSLAKVQALCGPAATTLHLDYGADAAATFADKFLAVDATSGQTLTTPIEVRFHYSIPSGKAKVNSNCADPLQNTGGGLSAVCGAGWSGTAHT